MSCRTTQITIAILAIVAVGVFFLSDFPSVENHSANTAPKTDSALTYATTSITVGTTTIIADVADTPAKRTKGLSGRTELPEGHGMLFIFDAADTHSFWMKDMHVPIDIFWIDKNREVVHIKRNATPDSYPQSFQSLKPAQYVLETNTNALPATSIGTVVHMQ